MKYAPYLLAWLLTACGTLGDTSAASTTASAPVAQAVVAAPAPASAAATTSATPVTPPAEPQAPFAQPPLLIERDSAGPVPTDLPGPGYHCHWVAPGKRYCHGGFD